MKVVRGQTRWKDRASEEMRTVYLRDLDVRLAGHSVYLYD